jgi:hypothetical protein
MMLWRWTIWNFSKICDNALLEVWPQTTDSLIQRADSNLYKILFLADPVNLQKWQVNSSYSKTLRYKVLLRSSGNSSAWPHPLIKICICLHLLWCSPFCVNTAIPAGFPLSKALREVFCGSIFITSYDQPCISSMLSKCCALSFNFIFRNRKESQGAQCGE